jgi:hypothetical protein
MSLNSRIAGLDAAIGYLTERRDRAVIDNQHLLASDLNEKLIEQVDLRAELVAAREEFQRGANPLAISRLLQEIRERP